MARRVILAGFMGSGKTAVGKALAAATGMDFVDTDSLAEDRMGISIAQAFARRGEPYFRAVEEEVVSEALAREAQGGGAVISLGGGAVTSERVSRLLADEPAVVLLEVDTDTAFERSRGGGRPLARDRAEFGKLHDSRRELYRRVAKLTVDTEGREVKDIVAEIGTFLERLEG
ncbi:MAG: shikimate kinase [Gaiellales bacterium]|nr:MAG: shikimate kinase [Gaiellales bacterium]